MLERSPTASLISGTFRQKCLDSLHIDAYPSLNILLTSTCWRNDHNGFSHQGPGLIDTMLSLRGEVVRIYFPPDANCLLDATMPAAAWTYAIPTAWSERWPLRRFGFHGLSHAYASRRAAELLGRPLEELRIVTAHLGAGASLCAVEGGRSVDTTMGFTPLEGLVMATRSGSVDPGLLLWVQRHGGIGAEEMERALDRESGLLALSGRSGDMREVIAGAEQEDERCRLAFDTYIHRLAAGIAAMAAAMNGLDALVFTGGVGEGSPQVREAVARGTSFLGVALEPRVNGSAATDAVLSSEDAPVASLLVSAREDLEIATQVRGTVLSDRSSQA